MPGPVNRITPRLGAQDFQTYQIAAPVSSHWRPASCEEYGCSMGEFGWKMQLDLSTELGQKQARYIKHESGRRYTHAVLPSGLVELTFPSGQDCFTEHRVRMDREEKYIVRGGDFRGNPLRVKPRVHTKPEFWIEDFQENQDAINRVIGKG